MKYLYIEIQTPLSKDITHVDGDFIIQYSDHYSKALPYSIIDRKNFVAYNLDYGTSKYTKLNAENKQIGKTWSAEGVNETVIDSKIIEDSNYGKVLEITTTKGTEASPESLRLVHEYVSPNHPLLNKYALIDNQIDWRVLLNNYFENHTEYPWLIKYYSHESTFNTKHSFSEITKFEERTYSQMEIDKLKQVIKQAKS